jgi:hypothetical protein
MIARLRIRSPAVRLCDLLPPLVIVGWIWRATPHLFGYRIFLVIVILAWVWGAAQVRRDRGLVDVLSDGRRLVSVGLFVSRRLARAFVGALRFRKPASEDAPRP